MSKNRFNLDRILIKSEELDRVAKKLNMEVGQIQFLISSGLLGDIPLTGVIKNQAIDDFRSYGTQWNERARAIDDSLLPDAGTDKVPPPSTVFQQKVLRGQVDTEPTKWIAHFYFRPNDYFFLPPEDTVPAGPCPVLLSKYEIIGAENKKLGIYPDPDGRLALISTMVDGPLAEDPLGKARTYINPFLNHLTAITNHALPIVQQLLIGFPSGEVITQRTTRETPVELKLSDFTVHEPLINAEYLYRLALTVNDPTYAYLSYWRAIEAVDSDLAAWQKRNNLPMVGFGPTKTPDNNYFGEWRNMKFNEIINQMTGSKRNGIAHGGKDGSIITGAYFDDIQEILNINPVLRFIARSKIAMFKHNLDIAKAVNK
ncbi:hypothetical protein YA0001_25945 [Pseudomonas viridiflava]|uniref:methylamine utilization protein MauJ n=1 Tax=Pseudomonas viridiflava TaxID=33069 RepID=UPI0018E5AB12|nr:methylamine utilization protein MauJ [Pseudomonas viridiflava]MBI6578724.1 hypothetical protein [Pseudomonas viridiflava]MBI6609510.1 hypothetical protein [Pseudomonas viridiflava]MBI6640289.1 hypothetical protein [Pseudomonas viridiflava]MBI6871015.1 hypothetical protein [Pseudomonas viridiflava]